jgi:hypothetical protein
MMARVKYNSKYNSVRKRLKYVETHIVDFLQAHAMNYAVRFIQIWKEGIKKDNFGLTPLTRTHVNEEGKVVEGTVEKKRRMTFKKGRGSGRSKIDIPYKQPETPLYGAGLDIDQKTYINMLRIFKWSNAYKVMPSWAKHHKSDLKLKDLFDVHEKGRTIIRKDGTAIRIPPRPAFFIAYRRFLAEKRQANAPAKFQRELNKFISTGESSWFSEIIKKMNEGDKYKEK